MLSTAFTRMQAAKMLARLHHHLGSPERSSQVLEQQLRDFPEATDLTHINILAELYMDAGKHEQASSLLRQAEQLPCMQDGVPIDLKVSTLAAPCLCSSYVTFHTDDLALRHDSFTGYTLLLSFESSLWSISAWLHLTAGFSLSGS